MSRVTKLTKIAVPAALVAFASFSTLISCQDAFISGLGKKVDIDPPTVRGLYPQVGSFIRSDDAIFKAEAHDDMSVVRVEAAYNVSPTDRDAAHYQWEPGTLSTDPNEKNIWIFHKNTVNLIPDDKSDKGDGTLYVWFRATDESGKKGFSDILDYEVKNNPPKVMITVPLMTDADLQPGADYPELVTGGDLIGSVRDRQGIAPGYPKIKFWAPPPINPLSPVPTSEAAARYISPRYAQEETIPWVEGMTNWEDYFPMGRTGMEFFFTLAERDAGGNITRDPITGTPQTPLAVDDAPYRYRIFVKDLSGGEAYYPDPALYPDGAPLKIIAQASLPELEVDPDYPAYAQEQEIKAKTYHQSNIKDLKVSVKDKKGQLGTPNALVRLQWDALQIDQSFTIGGKTLKGMEGIIMVKPGLSVPVLDADSGQPLNPPGTFLFDSGQYEFSVEAQSKSSTISSRAVQVILDSKPPTVNISSVDNELYLDYGLDIDPKKPNLWEYTDLSNPAVPLDPHNPLTPLEAIKGIPGYFVNGQVSVNAVAFDDFGLEQKNGKDCVKWFTTNTRITNFGQTELKTLYEDTTRYNGTSGDWLDGNNKIRFDSTALGTSGTGVYWVYVIAMDKAENYGYAERKLQLNQRTNIPVFNLPFMDRTVNDEKYLVDTTSIPGSPQPAANVMNTVEIQVELRDDDGINLSSNASHTPPLSPPQVLISTKTANNLVPMTSTYNPIPQSPLSAKNFGFSITETQILGALKNAGQIPSTTSALPGGTYFFKLTFMDKNGTPGGSREIYFAKDNDQPVVRVATINGKAPQTPYFIPMLNNVRFTGIINESSGIGNLVKFGISYPGRSYDVRSYLTDSAGTPVNAANNNLDLSGGTWALDLDFSGMSGTIPIDIIAVDRYGKTFSHPTLYLTIDDQGPVVDITNTPQAPATEIYLQTGQSIKGTAKDRPLTVPGNPASPTDTAKASGLERIIYKVEPAGTPSGMTVPYAPYPADWDTSAYKSGGWSNDITAGANWSLTLKDSTSDSRFKPGPKVIYVIAFDQVGNPSDVQVMKNFTIDNAPPEIYHLTGGVTKTPGLEIDSAALVKIGSSYYSQGPFTLKGFAEDDGVLKEVTITQQAYLPNGTLNGQAVTVWSSTAPANPTDFSTAALPALPLGDTPSTLKDGIYTYTVTATDGTGKTSTWTSDKVVVDRHGPALSIDRIPNGRHDGTAALSIRGSAKDPGPEYTENAAWNAPNAPDLSSIEYMWYALLPGTALPAETSENLSRYPTNGAAGGGAGTSLNGWNLIRGSKNWNFDHAFSSGDPEGTYTVYMRTRDLAGNWSSTAWTATTSASSLGNTQSLEYDKNPPELKWADQNNIRGIPSTLSFPADFDRAVRYYASGNFTFDFSAFDTNALDPAAPYTVTRTKTGSAGSYTMTTAEISQVSSSGTPPTAVFRVSQALSGLGAAPEGEYLYTITVKDRAGKTVSGNLRVFVDTIAPVIDKINRPGDPAIRLFVGDEQDRLEAGGTIVESGSGLGKIYYTIRGDTTVPAETPAQISGGTPGQGGTGINKWYEIPAALAWSDVLSFVNNSSTHLPELNEGTYYLYVRAVDNAGNWSTQFTDASGAPYLGRRFEVDLNAPELKWAAQANIQGAPASFGAGTDFDGAVRYYSNGGTTGSFTFDFSAFDTNALDPAAPYTVRRQKTGVSGSTTMTAAEISQVSSSGTPPKVVFRVSQALNGTGMTGDGEYLYTITVKDRAGKTVSGNLRVYVDTTAPEITAINKPGDPSVKLAVSDSKTSLEISGTAAETGSGLKEIWYKIIRDNSDPPAHTVPPAGETVSAANGWARIPAALAWSDLLDFTGSPKDEGSYYLYMRALDNAGNWSKQFSDDPAGTGIGRRFDIDIAPPALQWTAQDSIQGIPSTLNFPADFDGTLRYYVGKTFSFNFRAMDTNVLDGVNPYTVTRTKVSGPGVHLPNLAAASTVGTDTMNPDTRERKLSQNVLRPGDAGYDQSTDGEYLYTIAVKDRTGKTVSGSLRVYVDTTAPELSIVRPARTPVFNTEHDTAIEIGGTLVESGSGIRDIYYRIVSNSTAVPAETNAGVEALANNWKKLGAPGTNWYEPLSFSPTGEGSQYLYVRAVDNAGNWSEQSSDDPQGTKIGRRYEVDKSPPEMKLSAVKGITVLGSAAEPDLNSVPTVRTRYANGKDSASLNTFTFELEVEDTNALALLGTGAAMFDNRIVVRENGTSLSVGLAAPAQVLVKADAVNPDKKNTLTITRPIGAAAGAIPDGEYTYSITVFDRAGKPVQGTYNLRVDTTAPVLSITSPARGFPSGVADTIFINGTAAETGSGVKEIWYKINSARVNADHPYKHPSSAYTSEALANAAGWYKLLFPSNAWSETLFFSSPLNEGTHYLFVYALDNAGNWSNQYEETPPSGDPNAGVPVGRRFEVDLSPPELKWIGASSDIQNLPVFGTGGADFDGSRFYAGSTGAGVPFTFTFDFRVHDSNKLASPAYTVTRAGGNTAAATALISPVSTGGPGDTQEYRISQTIRAGTADQGEYTYTIRVRDQTGKLSMGTIKIVVDREGPAVNILTPPAPSPNPYSHWGANLAINGTADDPGNLSPIAEIHYAITNSTTPPAHTASPYTGWERITPPGTSWVKTHTFTTPTEGESYLHVIAKDAAGNWGSIATRYFEVDSAPPYIKWDSASGLRPGVNAGDSVENTQALTRYVKGNFSFSFNVGDLNGLAAGSGPAVNASTYKIERQTGNSAKLDITNNAALTRGPPAITGGKIKDIKLTVSELAASFNANADIVYTITTTDMAGKTSTAAVRVVMDRDPPTVDITQFTRLVSSGISGTNRDDNVNGWIEFVIASSDLNGVSRLKYWILPDSAQAPTGWASTGGIVLGDLEAASPVSIPRPAIVQWNTRGNDTAGTAVVDKKDYKLYILALDPSGNEGWLSPATAGNQYGTLHVDEDTDKPALAVTNPPTGTTGFINNTNVQLTGRVSDDDGILGNNTQANNNSVQYRWSNSSAAPAGTWTNARVTGTGNQYQTTFESNGAIPFSGDGPKVIEVLARDHWDTKVGADKTGSVSTQSDIKTISFILDTTPPAITVTGPAANQTFRENYNSGTAPNGFKTTGHVVETYLYNLKVSLDGGAYQDITASLSNPGDGHTNPRAWEYTITDAVFNALPQGVHTLSFEALDKAGNLSTVQRVFYKDTVAPEINFSNINEQVIKVSDVGQGSDFYNNKRGGVTQLEEANAALRGNFSDEYSRLGSAMAANPNSAPAPNANEYYFEYRIYNRNQLTGTGGAAIPAWEKGFLGADPNKAPAWIIPLTGSSPFWAGNAGLPDGLYWFDIRTADRAGNGYTNSTDPLVPGIKENIAFALDRSPPALTINTPPMDGEIFTSVPGGIIFSLSGIASDANFKELRIKVDNGTAAVHSGGTLGETVVPQARTYTWNWSLSKAVFDALADGPHTVTVSAEDDAGRITDKVYNFIKDTAAPVVDFLNIDKVHLTKAEVQANDANYTAKMGRVTLIRETDPAIQGSFMDAYSKVGYDNSSGGQYYFEYRIYNKDKLLTDAIPATWEKVYLGTDPAKSLNWAIPLNGTSSLFWTGSAGIPDGAYWLDIRVKDRLGNHNSFTAGPDSGLITNMAFAVDRNAPEISINETEGTIYGVQTGNVFTLTGTARDANLSDVLVRIDNGVDTALPFTAGNPVEQYSPTQLKTYTLNWSLSAAAFAPLAEGQHSISITARDSAGRAASREWVFHKDSTRPVLEYLNMDPAVTTNNFQDTTAKIQGVAKDLYGIYSIETKLEKFDYTNSTWGLVSDTTGTLSADNFTLLEEAANPGDSLGNNKNWTKDIGAGGLALSEGRYRAAVRVTDRANPAANVSLNNKPQSGTGAFVPGTDEVIFVVDYAPPALVIDPIPAFSNGDNSAVSRPNGFILTGTANDGNGMHPGAPIQVYLYEGAALVGGPFNAAATAVDYFSLTWDALIPAAPGGSYPGLVDGKTYTIRVIAQDSSTKTITQSKDITYDITPPSSNIYAPLLNTSVSGAVDIRGESGDNNAVKLVEYQLGKADTIWHDAGLSSSAPASGFRGGLYAWSYTVTDDQFRTFANPVFSERVTIDYTVNPPNIQSDTTGASNIWKLPFKIRVTDIAGNTKVNDYYLILDPDGDIPRVIDIRSPQSGSQMGGIIRAQGMAQDDDWIYAVLVRTYKGNVKIPANIVHYPVKLADGVTPNPSDTRLTNADGWALAAISNPGMAVNWSLNLNAFGELNGPGGQMQEVIMEVMPVDSKLYQTAASLPSAADLAWYAAHPEENRLGVPKEVIFIVNAGVPAIENIKIIRTNDTVNYDSGIKTGGTFTIAADMTVGDTALSRIQWRSSGFSSGSKYEDMLDGGSSFAAAKPDTAIRTVKMPVTVHTSGQFETGRKYFIKELGNTNWNAIGVVGTPAEGAVFVKNAVPATGSGTAYRAEGGTNIGSPYNLAAAFEQRFIYPVTITIDSLSNWPIPGTSSNYSSGIFLLDFLVEDYQLPYAMQVQANLNIQIDNFYPSGSYRAPRNASTQRYWVEGQGADINNSQFSGPIEGVKEVLAYFRQNGVWYNPNHDVMTPVTAQRIKDMTSGGTIGPFSDYPDMNTQIGTATLAGSAGIGLYGAVRIDKNEINEDTDKDGYVERFSLTGGTLSWGFQFDSTKFADGPVELHYVIVDDAGNSTHYKQDLFVRNKPPVIGKITLKTDYNFDHQAGTPSFPSEAMAFAPADRNSYQTTGFNTRNFRLTFDVETVAGSGNGNKTFRVLPVTVSAAAVQSTALTIGKVYIIDDPGNTGWSLTGAASNLAGTVFVCTDPAPNETSTGQPATGTAKEITGINFTNAAAKEVSGVAGTGASISFGNRSDWTVAGANSDTDFGQSGSRIPDSTVPNGSLFLVKVFDSTVPGGAEADQEADVVLVGLDINNRNMAPPAALINPFHWTSETDNSLYGNSRDNGHIELEGDLPAAFNQAKGVDDRDPKVSGQISIRGTVTDNNAIGSLWVRMDNFAFPGAASSTTLVPGQTWYRIADFSSAKGLEGVDQWGNGWKSGITTVYLDERGHSVNWRLDLDTNRRPAAQVAAADQALWIIAQDVSLNTQAEGSIQTKADPDRTNYYRMDIVPFISEVVTRLSSAYPAHPSAFNRSALGWYPVREEEAIELKGFNFNGSSTVVSVNGKNLSSVNAVGGNNQTRISARVDNDGTNNNINTIDSGALEARSANNIGSLNNRNNSAIEYNREPNGVNNDILTNDRYLYVWNTGPLDKDVNTNTLTNPFMRMDSGGTIYMTYGKGPQSLYFYDDGEKPYIEQCYNKYHNTTVAFDEGGHIYGAATNTDRVSDNIGGATSFTYFQWERGNRYHGTSAHYDTGTNKRRLELSLNSDTGVYNANRVQIPRIAVLGSGTRNDPANVYMSYFDANNRFSPVVFRYNGDVTSADSFNDGFASNLTDTNPGTAADAQEVADINTKYQGGLYTAVGALSTGRAVIAWYDASRNALIFSYSDSTNPSNTTTRQWQANARVIDADFCGWHVDLTVDGNDGIHIAYYTNGNGGLRYAYLASPNSTPEVVQVDTFLSAGTKLMINTRKETRTINGKKTQVYVPYISYFHASFPQTRNSIRVAWQNDFTALRAGTDSSDRATGAWEFMTVPADSVPNEDFVCNGVPTGGSFTSGLGIPLRGAALSNTVFLGYYTNNNYERAYLKK